MITIDVLDAHTTRTEKPCLENQAGLQNQQRAAHTTHLLKRSRAGDLAVDVQRLLEQGSAKVLTLAEQYVLRR